MLRARERRYYRNRGLEEAAILSQETSHEVSARCKRGRGVQSQPASQLTAACSLLLSVAIERGIHFEFSFAPAIRDATSRRYLFSNLLSMLRLTRGRNLAFSSGAS